MTDETLANLDLVIRKHLNNTFLGMPIEGLPPRWWAKEIMERATAGPHIFGRSHDIENLARLKWALMEARNAIDGLSQSTISADTSDGVKRKIVAAMMGKVPESRVDEARAKIADLETWLSGISSRPEYKVQAAKKRDWRAVSVADFCRKMWGRSEWARLGRPYPVFSDGTLEAVLAPEATESSYHAAFRKFVEECAPRTEKFDAPGPFGRFLEDVFGALGIHGRGGQPLSAASALRSLKEAGKQIATK